MKKIFFIILFVFLLSITVSAEDHDTVYKEQFDLSGADELDEALPEDVRDFFNDYGIDPSDSNWVTKITQKNVFKHIFGFYKNGAKIPFRSGASILSIILIIAAVTALGNMENTVLPTNYVAVIAVIAVAAVPLWESLSAATNTVKGCGTFMLSFIPVFASIVAVSGGTVTSVSMSTLLLGASQVVVSVASFAVLPLMGAYLGMSLCASVSPLQNINTFSECIKKGALWILSLVSTLFTGILGIQTAVNSAADSLTLRTARFIIGSSVPVAGSALSEAVSTVTASVSLLRSSVGIYGIFALITIVLPIVIEIVLWRTVCIICTTAADLLSVQKVSGILKAVDSVLSLLLGIILLVVAMFIISLTVVIGAVKS